MKQSESNSEMEERREKLQEEREEILGELSAKKDREKHLQLLVRLMDVEDELEELFFQKRV